MILSYFHNERFSFFILNNWNVEITSGSEIVTPSKIAPATIPPRIGFSLVIKSVILVIAILVPINKTENKINNWIICLIVNLEFMSHSSFSFSLGCLIISTTYIIKIITEIALINSIIVWISLGTKIVYPAKHTLISRHIMK